MGNQSGFKGPCALADNPVFTEAKIPEKFSQIRIFNLSFEKTELTTLTL